MHTQTFLPASHATCAHTNTRTHAADAWLCCWITWDNLSWSQSSAPKTHLAPTGEPELSATKSTKWTSSEATLEQPTYTWHNVMWCNPVKYSVRNRRQLKILSSLSHETYSQQSSARWEQKRWESRALRMRLNLWLCRGCFRVNVSVWSRLHPCVPAQSQR